MRSSAYLSIILSASLLAVSSARNVVNLRLADGFDFPVGLPDAKGYYKARGFTPNGHLGEDWNGVNGGNSDLGDSVYATGDGIVVQSRDVRVGWGNVVIIRHAYRDAKDGKVRVVDSLYGHLNERFVSLNQHVKRGQRIGTIGTNRGMYFAHLHFEIRKNLNIGMHRKKFAKTYGNYHSPTHFIKQNRKTRTDKHGYTVPINTFAAYPGGSTAALRSTPNVVTAKSVKIPKSRIPVSSDRRTSRSTAIPLLSKASKSPSGGQGGTGRATRVTSRRSLSPEVATVLEEQSTSKEEARRRSNSKARRERFWSSFKKKFGSEKSNKKETAEEARKERPAGKADVPS